MELNAVYENVPKLNGEFILSDKIKAETKSDVSTESIGKIINLNSTAHITDIKVENGKIKYTGRVIFFLCYEDVEKNVKKYESGVEFKGEISDEKITEKNKVKVDIKKCKTEGDVSGVFLSLTAHLEIKAKVCVYKEVKALKEGDNLIIKSEEKTVVKGLGERRGNFTTSEEKDLNYKIEEILFHTASASVTAVQCGVGAIIIDGEIFVSSVFLQSGDKKGIIKENFSYPFRAEIEYEECMPNFKAKDSATVKSFKTDISVDEEKNISRETVSVQLLLSGEAFTVDSVNFASDAFDIKHVLKVESDKVIQAEPKDVKSQSKEFSGRVQLDVDGENSYLLTMGEESEVISRENKEDGVLITGIFTLNSLFNGDGGIITRKIEIPFEEEIKGEGDKISDISICVKNSDLIKITESEWEVRIDAVISYSTESEREFTVINNISVEGEKKENDSAISVYIPNVNEDMWSLSKRLNVSPETLAVMNPELQFPLSGEERIVVYRQK